MKTRNSDYAGVRKKVDAREPFSFQPRKVRMPERKYKTPDGMLDSTKVEQFLKWYFSSAFNPEKDCSCNRCQWLRANRAGEPFAVQIDIAPDGVTNKEKVSTTLECPLSYYENCDCRSCWRSQRAKLWSILIQNYFRAGMTVPDIILDAATIFPPATGIFYRYVLPKATAELNADGEIIYEDGKGEIAGWLKRQFQMIRHEWLRFEHQVRRQLGRPRKPTSPMAGDGQITQTASVGPAATPATETDNNSCTLQTSCRGSGSNVIQRSDLGEKFCTQQTAYGHEGKPND